MIYPKVKTPVTVPQGTPDKTLFVCVDNTWQENGCPASLEDCARGYWREQDLSSARGYDCEWLMARKHGRIVGVWRIDRKKGKNGWMISSATPRTSWPSNKPTPSSQRRGCELISVPEETEKKFLNKVVHLGRSGNPLRGYFV